MQAGRRLVEYVERLSALCTLQFGGQLDTLSFASRQFGRRLAKPDLAEPNLAEHAQRSA
jgi:hypothetical protein